MREGKNMGGGGGIVLTKINVFRLNLKDSREDFVRRGRGKTFHVEGPETEKAGEPKVESLVRGIWRLREPEAERGDMVAQWVERRPSGAQDKFV